MAITHRTAARALALQQSLQKAPYKFNFYQALRHIECNHPDAPRFGQSLKPADDPIRLAQQPSMAFAPSAIAAYEDGEAGRPPRLETFFFGIFGPNGPMPLHFTEYARDRLHNADDPTLCRFADIFHHRMLSLFYRAWADTQPTISYERPNEDRFARYVGTTCGLGMSSLQQRDEMPDNAKLYHAGILSNQTRSAEGLQTIISNFFQLPVKVEQFVGHWIKLPEDCLCRLGESPDSGSLGMNTVIGARVWDCQSRFRIVLGPLDIDQYQRLLPSGNSLQRLVSIVKNYIGMELSWDIQLILEKRQAPLLKLGKNAQLGWTTWLKKDSFDKDHQDLILDPCISRDIY